MEKQAGGATRLLFFFLGRGRLFRAILWGILGICLGALSFAYFSAGEIYEYQDTVDGVHLPPVDAIIVLAGGRGRIAAGGDIWYRYWELAQLPLPGAGAPADPEDPPLLYISGMGPKSNWNVLAKQVRRGVLEALKPENVVMERESANTEENALWVARYASQRHWKRILLMTSPYHMKRALYIFEQVLKRVRHPIEIETLSIYQEPFAPEEWRSGLHGVRVTLVEYLKWLWYRTVWKPA
jgi:uncharacterized SAM-binding protein YcdF (DUF218 family)